MAAQNQMTEHIVLFNFKPDVDSTKVAAIIDELNGLDSFNLATDISAGKLLRSTSISTPVTFTHIFRCRFRSTDDYHVYNLHSEHLRVGAVMLPVIQDILIVDWISNGIYGLPNPGSVMRLKLFKLKEEFVENKLVAEEIKNRFKAGEDISFGDNFCPVFWSKGYSIGVMAIFPDLEALDSDSNTVNLRTGKVKGSIEDELVVDYVFPLPEISNH